MGRGIVRFRFLLSALVLSAAVGAADTKPSWTVAVAAFDTGSLDPSERLAGDLVAGKLADALFGVATRTYSVAERQAYARRLASLEAESAAKALADKRSARDALLFSGFAEWKYRKELKSAEKAVLSAQASYEAALRAQPEVVAEKPLAAAKENAEGLFFAAPAAGEERAFCMQRAYDALLIGRVESYYGRTSVSIRLFSPYLNADLYSDETIFSVANREKALAELAGRLAAAASGKTQAILSVRVEPEEADIYLAGAFSGKGSVGPLERDPGKLTVDAELDGFERFGDSLELNPGERVGLSIRLPAVETTGFVFRAVDSAGADAESSVRLDGLYAGRTPYQTELPRSRLSFVQVESSDGRGAAAVVRPEVSGTVSLPLVPNLAEDATPTEDERRKFYGAFGRFSVAMPIAFFISGLAFSYENASLRYDESSELAALSDQAAFASAALWTATVAFAAESVFRFVRYLRISGSRAAKAAYVEER